MSPLGSSLRGDSGRCFATMSPCFQAVGFSKESPPPHVAWADEVPDAGSASPDPGPAEQVLAMSPMMYVQISIGKVTMPALVDSGAGSNFIEQGVADTLKLKQFPLKMPTKTRSPNGHLMECDSYAVVQARLWSLRFQVCLRVVSSFIGIILGIPFLRYFDPCISWREGTLKIYDGIRTWMAHIPRTVGMKLSGRLGLAPRRGRCACFV